MSPTGHGVMTSELHSKLRRAVTSPVTSSGSEVCTDNSECPKFPDICKGPDVDLARTLCPVMCGFCGNDVINECVDDVRMNCTDLFPEVNLCAMLTCWIMFNHGSPAICTPYSRLFAKSPLNGV